MEAKEQQHQKYTWQKGNKFLLNYLQWPFAAT